LKPIISKAITFINRDIKSHLGIKVNITPRKRDFNSGNITPKSENNTGLFGG
jgi:hypothetical protein